MGIVADAAHQKGTGLSTVRTALELGSPATAIAQATSPAPPPASPVTTSVWAGTSAVISIR
ncbi:hypothetical protein ABT173_28615 [Streptomyces sp. NPDC001795]|uniref:hypothetical protein n=1 Tax=unclassified Streptomyces TaxID=2593676 RepID=UPI00332F162A